MEFDTVLRNANTIDKHGIIREKINIYIKNGEIVKLDDSFNGNASAKEVIDCSNLFVTPGFVNLHTHSPMNVFKGIAEDVDIDSWFNKEIWPYESKLTEDDVYYGSLLAILEMLDNGVTAFADHYFYADKIANAVLETGIRGDIAITLFGVKDSFEEDLEKTIKLIKEKNKLSSRLTFRLGPHAPYTCPPKTLEKIVNIAKTLSVGIHIHMAETEKQVKDSLRDYGKTHFEILHEVGAFDLPVIVAHGIYIQEGDLRYIGNNTYFALAPKTYMKLGMGFPNIFSYRKELKLAIGTDGAASSNTLNPLEEARLFALLGKLQDNATEFTLFEVWKTLMEGHNALNFKTGDIVQGYKADLIFWDLNKPNTFPLHNPLASIIYSGDAQNIVHVMVDGVFLKKDGKLLFDTSKIFKEANNHIKNLLNKGKGNTNLSF